MADQNTINQNLKEKFTADLSEEQKILFKDFQKKSKRFINIVNRAYHKTIENKQHIKKIIRKNEFSNSLQLFYSFMRYSKSFTQSITKAQFQYEIALNSFLNRKIILSVYNSTDQEIYFFNEIGARYLYENTTANFGRGNISISKAKIKQIETMGGIDKDIKNQLEGIQEKWREVLIEALTRYNKKENNNMFFYRDEKNTRHYSQPFKNKGFIVEGYLRTIINNTEQKQNVEHGLKILKANSKKDSKKGSEEGDIVADEKGNLNFSNEISYHFASKTDSFSTEKVGQYLAIAEIVKNSSGLTSQDLKELLENNSLMIGIGEIGNRIFKAATKKAEKAITDEINKKKS